MSVSHPTTVIFVYSLNYGIKLYCAKFDHNFKLKDLNVGDTEFLGYVLGTTARNS